MILRNLLIEHSIQERITVLKQDNTWSSMGSDFLQKTTQEIAKTAGVSQEVYDMTLQDIETKVNFFEKQSTLINQLYQTYSGLAFDVQSLFHAYIGDKKGAAYNIICRHLDPFFNPPWHTLDVCKIPEFLPKIEALSNEIAQMGMNSPIVVEYLNLLSTSNAPSFF